MMVLKGIGVFAMAVFVLTQGFTFGMQEKQFDSSNEYESSEEYEFVVPQLLPQGDRGDFADLELYVKGLLKSLKPSQIGLVLDVDGTLTNYSDPTVHQGPAQPRGNAVPFVQWCMALGINLIVSSAWDPFEETIERLKEIGLGEVLKINQGGIRKGEENLFQMTVTYACLGHVASVKDTMVDTDDYFRLKPFAFHYVFPNLDLKTIKHWVCGDDNKDNISIFTNYIRQVYAGSEMKKEEIPDGVFVKMFYLSFAKGEGTLK